MKNKLTDLNDHLFAQLERLGDEDLKGEELMTELGRTKAVTSVAKEIISNGSLLLNVHRANSDGLFNTTTGKLPKLLTD